MCKPTIMNYIGNSRPDPNLKRNGELVSLRVKVEIRKKYTCKDCGHEYIENNNRPFQILADFLYVFAERNDIHYMAVQPDYNDITALFPSGNNHKSDAFYIITTKEFEGGLALLKMQFGNNIYGDIMFNYIHTH